MNDEVQLIDLKALFASAPSAYSTVLDIFSIQACPDPDAMERFVGEVRRLCPFCCDPSQPGWRGLSDDTREMAEDFFSKLITTRRYITREALIWDTICWYSEEILHENRAVKGWTPPRLGVVEAKAFARFMKTWLEDNAIPGEVTGFVIKYFHRSGPNQTLTASVIEYKAPEEK